MELDDLDDLDKPRTIEDFEELIDIFEKYIAQLVGVDWNDLIFDLNFGKLRVRELANEFISLEDRDTLKKQTFEDIKINNHHEYMIDQDLKEQP